MVQNPSQAVAPAHFPLPKAVIWLLCLIFSPIVGAVLYYAWKQKTPEAAKYANRVSLVTFVLWVAFYALKAAVLSSG